MPTTMEQGTDVTSAIAILRITVVTPEATVLRRNAEFVALPIYDGELGVLPGHAPLIGRLGYGEMRVREGSETVRYYIDGGFVQVADNVISVLTNRAVPAAQVDRASAEAQLAEAQTRRANSPELFEIRDRAIAQARAQIRIAGK